MNFKWMLGMGFILQCSGLSMVAYAAGEPSRATLIQDLTIKAYSYGFWINEHCVMRADFENPGLVPQPTITFTKGEVFRVQSFKEIQQGSSRKVCRKECEAPSPRPGYPPSEHCGIVCRDEVTHPNLKMKLMGAISTDISCENATSLHDDSLLKSLSNFFEFRFND